MSDSKRGAVASDLTFAVFHFIANSQNLKISYYFFFFFFDSHHIFLQKNYNLGQTIVDNFTNLSQIDFSMGCFTADFFAIF